MPINAVVFQGAANAPGIWYGKIEQRNNQETLVLFKGAADRSAPQKLKDKIGGIHKGEKLATNFIRGHQIALTSRFPNAELLERYLGSSIQNNLVLTNSASILGNLQKDVNGHANVSANLVSNGTGLARNISISWEP